VAEIYRSRELRGLRGESPKVGYSRLRKVKSRKGEKFLCGTAWTMCQNSTVEELKIRRRSREVASCDKKY
jgi:hypothetical protein